MIISRSSQIKEKNTEEFIIYLRAKKKEKRLYRSTTNENFLAASSNLLDQHLSWGLRVLVDTTMSLLVLGLPSTWT